MGLDIYLFNVRKNDTLKENETYTREDIEKIANISTFELKSKDICKTIRDKSVIINVIDKVFSPKLIGKYAKIDNVKDISRYAATYCGEKSKISFYLYDKDKNKIGDITIPYEDWDKVLIEKVFKYYACELKQIDYQRKGLNDYGWSHIPENCAYCDKKTVVREMVKGGLSKSFLDEFVKGETVIHCWW